MKKYLRVSYRATIFQSWGIKLVKKRLIRGLLVRLLVEVYEGYYFPAQNNRIRSRRMAHMLYRILH